MPRKQKKHYYIYKTTNVVTGKYYYGMHSTDNLEDGYYGSGRRLRYSINKYGEKNHNVEIIEHVDNREKLIEREKEIVNLNEIAKEDCMNIMVGGNGGFISEEHQRKRATIANKKLNNKLKNDINFYNEYCSKISVGKKKSYLLGISKKPKNLTFKEHIHTNETKEKMRESHKGMHVGNKNSQFGTCWITNGNDNKKIFKDNNIPNGWRLGRTLNINCLCSSTDRIGSYDLSDASSILVKGT